MKITAILNHIMGAVQTKMCTCWPRFKVTQRASSSIS